MDLAKIGTYPIRFRLFFERYPENFSESVNPFEITVVDKCANPDSLTPALVVDQEYTISAAPKLYEVAAFQPDPSWCTVDYSFYASSPELEGAVVTFDADSRTFSFNSINQVALAGDSSVEYLITVVGESGISSKKSVEAVFKLTLHNPCVDSAFVSLQPLSMANQTYTLYEPSI